MFLFSACASSPFNGPNPFEHTELLLDAEETIGGLIHASQIPQKLLGHTKAIVVFPNLVLNDGSSITIRTFHPTSAGRMQVTAWALGPTEESQSALARRLDSFLTFYGPGGFATPDDVEALEMVQAGLQSWREVTWSDISRGMNKDGEQLSVPQFQAPK